MFLNAAMTRADIDQVLAAADRSLGSLKSALPALGPVEKMAFLAA
jgi:hypothetical protein